jgi:hypothetical protein
MKCFAKIRNNSETSKEIVIEKTTTLRTIKIFYLKKIDIFVGKVKKDVYFCSNLTHR